MSKPEIFLSYAWGGESEKIVNELDNAFQKKDIALIRDKRDLGFKGIITEFMQRIGKGHAVVVVISDKYLKSPYCMFELLEIYRNQNFIERIFPIVLNDAEIFNPLPRLQYHEYWEDKRKELDNAIKQRGLDAITVIWEEFKIYKRIFDNLGEVVNILTNINALTPDMHRADNFNTIIEAVEMLVSEEARNEENAIEPVDIEFIVETLQKRECILFLGPELFRTSDNSSSKQQAFFENLALRNQGKILSYNQNGFFLFSNPQAKKRIFMKIVDFYEEFSDVLMVRQIAEIPFHTIVSINPDILLKKFFEEHKHPYSFEYFDPKRVKDIVETPTIKKPLLYNLCGSILDPDTLILTHDDLFSYFKALLGNNILPQQLRTQLESAKDYIFLGFQFDKWYVQLILSLLNLHDEKYDFMRYASANTINEETKSLCINHFKIEFIGPDSNLFIHKLHEQCREVGILRNFDRPDSLSDLSDLGYLYQSRSDCEKKLYAEKDPKNLMRYEDELENIKEKIAQFEKSFPSQL